MPRQISEETTRSYQHEAIQRVGKAFERGKRRALLVMATGMGKTRTTMALIDVFVRKQWKVKGFHAVTFTSSRTSFFTNCAA